MRFSSPFAARRIVVRRKVAVASTLVLTGILGVVAAAPSVAGTGPVITPVDPITVEADRPLAGLVTVPAVTATDATDGTVPVFCTAGTGVYPLGTTTVSCSATDSLGLTSTIMFTVTVVDTSVPLFTPPAAITVEATLPGGAQVTLPVVTATDANDGTLPVDCGPRIAVFNLGVTQVRCTATDPAGNTFSATFPVHVIDTSSPVLTTVPAIRVPASGPLGAVVSYTAPTAADTNDGALPVQCAPASGSTFPIGTTSVTCSAHDPAGNSGTSTFTVTVTSAQVQITDLITTVQTLSAPAAVRGQLTVALQRVATLVTAGRTTAACRNLGDLVETVREMSGHRLTDADAKSLVAALRRVRSTLGC